MLSDPIIEKIAKNHGKDTSQVILRFELQEGAIIFPKSIHPERMKRNMDIFDFILTHEEMDEMRTLDTGKGCHNPDAPGVAEFLLGAFDVHAKD